METLKTAFQTLGRQFLSPTEIRTVGHGMEKETRQQIFLKDYYTTLGKIGSLKVSGRPALLEAAQTGKTKLYAIFGGQGAGNLSCLKELSQLYSIYGSLIEEVVDTASNTLKSLTSTPKSSGFHEESGFDVKKWLTRPETMPNPNLVSMAPLSFPVIGLLSFAHYTVTCRVVGKTPWGMRDCLQGMAGHSQGIIVAAVIASSGSWEEYYKSVAIAMELLFRIGLESYFAVPVFSQSQAEMRDYIQAGEGQPSPMLNVRGLDQESLQGFITDTNRAVSEKDSIYLALIRSPDNMVISGPPASLKELCLRLRELEVGIQGVLIQYRFLPISSPFHSPHLQDAAKRIIQTLNSSALFSASRYRISMYHSCSGKALRVEKPRDMTKALAEMVLTQQVDWPNMSDFPDASHILDFGPGRVALLQRRAAKGPKARVIIASDLGAVSDDFDKEEELFSPALRLPESYSNSLYQPSKLQRQDGISNISEEATASGAVKIVAISGESIPFVPQVGHPPLEIPQ